MGKRCVHIITKGKPDRIGKPCNVYAGKVGYDGKNYCSGHLYLYLNAPKKAPVKDLQPDKQQQSEKQQQEEKKTINLNEITFENGYSLDEVIDAKFEMDNQSIKRKDLYEYLEYKINNLIDKKINKLVVKGKMPQIEVSN